ncbi:MAG: DUF2079 domain-containing protein [Actinomycetota bacterium]|nr:DUF2079 domain-containing protein [Actinomycetota bacterium]
MPAGALVVAYFVWFTHLSVAVNDGYGTGGYDLGIFDQGVWLLSRFHAPFVTVMGRNLWGDHTNFVLLLAVPLYWIAPYAQTLLVLQAALIAGAAVPVYLLGRRLTDSTPIATLLTAAFLLNPALQYGNLEQFHPECFLVLAMSLAVYAAVVGNGRLLAVGVVLGLLVKEDTALLMVPLGVWVAARRNWRWGARIVVGALASMALDYLVVIRLLLGDMGFYLNRLPFGGAGGLVTTTLTHPLRLWRYIRSGNQLWYLWQLGSSFGWVWLLAPEVALIGVLNFLENFISTFPYMQEIQYHYSLAIEPVLALGTVWAVSRLRTPRRRVFFAGVSFACALLCGTLWGLAPWSRQTYPHWSPSSPQVAAINAIRRDLPAGAVVSAYYNYVPHVDHRLRCYQWPTPFAAQYWGLYNEEGKRLPFAGQVQYLFLPTVLPDAPGRALLHSLQPDFRVVAGNAVATLWKRR